MSDGLALSPPLTPVDAALSDFIEAKPLSGPHLDAVDNYIATHAPARFSEPLTPGELGAKLAQAGLSVQPGRGLMLAQNQAVPGAPNLLVYLPGLVNMPANLKAILAAAEAWHNTSELAPVGLKLLFGPANPATILKSKAQLAADGIVYLHGEYTNGRPLVSLGLKGRLEVELRVNTMTHDAPSAYSEVLPGASWMLVRALESIKSDAQEIRIEGFEDELAVLPGEESRLLIQTVPDHAERLAQNLKEYGLQTYLFELSDKMVLQTMCRVPTVNISAIDCGKSGRAGRLRVPSVAKARLDFHLVPDQHPDRIFELLKAHIIEKEFEGVEVVRLAESYAPTRTPLTHPFVGQVLAAVQSAVGKPALVVPISPFSGPLATLKTGAGSADAPAVCVGLDETRPSEADFVSHVRFLARMLMSV